MMEIAIEEIDNGFILTLFDQVGPSKLDQKVYVRNWATVWETIDKWRKQELESRQNG